MKIIIDIDNTLIDYRKSLFNILQKSNITLQGLSSANKMSIIKMRIKEELGDLFWQKIQAHIYSDLSDNVCFYKDSGKFIREAYKKKWIIYLISHKTKFGMHKAKNINIRKIAVDRVNKWKNLEKIDDNIFATYYVETFNEKIELIKSINPKIIVDDLLEIHTNINNLQNSINILFEGNDSSNGITKEKGIICVNSWQEINTFFKTIKL